MNSVGEKAIKMGCLQVLPGQEFQVVKALKEACKAKGTRNVILKGLGFYDIFIFYECEDFKSHLTMAGTIPGIINSYTFLCFPCLGCDTEDFFNKIEDTTFAGLSLLKFNHYSKKKLHEIEKLLVKYLNDKVANHWNTLGTLGWNEVILLITYDNIQDIINALLDLNYKFEFDEKKSDFILKTFSYVGINHDRLPILEKVTLNISEMQEFLESDFSLKAPIPDTIITSINISLQPLYYNHIKEYWDKEKFILHESLGNFDIVLKRRKDELGNEVEMSWAYFLSCLLCFRQEFRTRINSTHTNIATKISGDKNGDKKKSQKKEPERLKSVSQINYEQGIDISYKKFDKVFKANTPSLFNHFYTLNSAIQNAVSGYAFLDMKEYPLFLLESGKAHINDESSERTIDKLFLGATEVIRNGTSLRSYGIAGNQERVHGHFSEIRGGAQRALLAMEFIPDHVISRLKSKWYGFINVGDPKFAHFNEVIICPTKSLWEPEQWWALYHEIGHIICERVPWTKKDDPVIGSFLMNMPSPRVWHHFLIELFAEVLGFIIGFFSNFDLYNEVLWEHLINIEPTQKEFTPLWPYLIRSFFVKLFELRFRRETITDKEFRDEVWLYKELLKHIEKIQNIPSVDRDWPRREKLFFAANHCQTFKELYPIANHLNLQIKLEEEKKDISFAPPDYTKDRQIEKAMKSIMKGKVCYKNIHSPESLLYLIFLNRRKMDFPKRIAGVLTFWNMSQERLKGN